MAYTPYSFNFPGEPVVPFALPIEGGIYDGQQITICGIVDPEADRFTINLQDGDSTDDDARPDTPLHISVRLIEEVVVRNTHQDGWGDEERDGDIPVVAGYSFMCVILVRDDAFQIDINGVNFTCYYHRIDKELANFIRVDGDVIVNSVTFNSVVPFAMPIEGGIYNGQQIRIRGKINSNAEVFTINLQDGDDLDDDERPYTTLHMSVRLEEDAIVRNNKEDEYGDEEREGGNPLQAGDTFLIVVRVECGGYQIDINGEMYTFFEHRMDRQLGNHLRIDGDVVITNVKFNAIGGDYEVPYISYPAFERLEYPSKPFIRDLYGLTAGRVIYIRGSSDATSRFDINLCSGPGSDDDVAFHFDVRFHHDSDDMVVVRNHKLLGNWGDEERHGGFPFSDEEGAEFEIVIKVGYHSYKVAVNNEHFIHFYHRMPVETINTLTICNDVDIHEVRIQ